MSNKVSLTVILIVFAILLTHLYDENQTAHNFIVEYASKVGINLGNYITNTPVCPKNFICTPQ